jgi:hypothetical protein
MTFHVGQTISFGRRNGEQSRGEVLKINAKSVKVKLLEGRGVYKAHPVGGIWRVHPSLCSTVAENDNAAVAAPPTVGGIVQRGETKILGDIAGIYAAMSPENLHCDGEISHSAAMRKYRRLQRELQSLFTEIGRVVTEGESYSLEKEVW